MDSQKNTPNLEKIHPTSVKYQRIVYRHGPIPESQELARYEEILPGIADRIVTMAEKQQQASIKLESRNWIGKFSTMLLTRLFLYFLVAVAFILVMNGKEVAALLTALAPIMSIFVSTFREPESKL